MSERYEVEFVLGMAKIIDTETGNEWCNISNYAFVDLCYHLNVQNRKIAELEEKLNKNKKPYERFTPCICGCNKRESWTGENNDDNKTYWFYKCSKCGLKGPNAPSRPASKTAWNNMIKNLTEEKKWKQK